MSGLEAVGAASAVLGFVEIAIGLLGRLRQAYDRQVELPTVFDTHIRELNSTQNIIQIVNDEQALQTAAVASELREMETVLERLVDILRAFNDEKSSIHQFAHQLVRGSRDTRKLGDAVEDLGRVKLNLMLRIQAAHVGLTKSLDNSIAVNTDAVERVNNLLEPVLGEGRGLRIANMLWDRHAQDDGTVILSDADVASLHDEPPVALYRIPSQRLVLDNLTEDQALQINGPIGQNGWREVQQLAIKNNVATGTATQVNHSMSLDVFDQLLAHRSAHLIH